MQEKIIITLCSLIFALSVFIVHIESTSLHIENQTCDQYTNERERTNQIHFEFPICFSIQRNEEGKDEKKNRKNENE